MFKFNNASLGMKDPGDSNALPNNFGKVRTLKEDLENAGKGRPDEEDTDINNILPAETKSSIGESYSPKKEPPQIAPNASRAENVPDNPFQSIPTPAPISSLTSAPFSTKPSPSQSFFPEKPSSEKRISPEHGEDMPPAQKKKGKFMLPFIIFIFIAVAGSGFYYYWFYIKSNSSAVSSTPTSQPSSTSSQPASTDTSEPQNDNLRHLVIDISQNSTEIKSAVQKFATDFSASASDKDLVEIKVIDKNNQPIGKKDFFNGLGTTIPDSVLMKLSEDYSLFAKKEMGAIRLGLVFKTVTSSALTDEMKNWEPTLANDLNSLFIGQSPLGTGAFSSSRYKNADIRYFNFSSPANTSVDYSIISNFLIIGTSKDTTRSILDYMSEK